MEDAPWRLGIFRLQPWLGVRDAQVVNNLVTAADETDFTATVGAGLRAYARSGSSLVWAVHALPEYSWWADSVDKRRFNGRYGLGLFGYLNRVRFEASERLEETQGFFSSELQEITAQRRERSRFAVEVDLTPRIALLAGAALTRFEALEEESPIFGRLDRDERVWRVGARYRLPGDRWSFDIGYEASEADFANGARELSNSGDASLFGVDFTGPRFAARLDLAFRNLDADLGSSFAGLDETTGHLDVVWDLSSRSSLATYARRSFGFSVAATSSHFVTDRFGARLFFNPVRRLGVSLYAEAGKDDYAALAGAGVALDRSDDVTSLGVALSLPFTKYLSLSLRAQRTDFDSNLDVFDRDVTSVGLGVELGPQIQEWIGRMTERLRLGDPGGTW